MPHLETLIDAESLASRITTLGRAIRSDHADTITLIGVLRGAVPFMADLMRAIDGPVHCEYLSVCSTRGTDSTGQVELRQDLAADISGRHCVIVEDIVDTGLTLDWLLRELRARGPASLRVASLLDKPSRRLVQVPVDYVGFTVPDAWIVGYGLDLDGLYRNLPYVAVLHPDANPPPGS